MKKIILLATGLILIPAMNCGAMDAAGGSPADPGANPLTTVGTSLQGVQTKGTAQAATVAAILAAVQKLKQKLTDAENRAVAAESKAGGSQEAQQQFIQSSNASLGKITETQTATEKALAEIQQLLKLPAQPATRTPAGTPTAKRTTTQLTDAAKTATEKAETEKAAAIPARP
jgi:hypothetical protein